MKLLTITALPLITVIMLSEAVTSAYNYDYLGIPLPEKTEITVDNRHHTLVSPGSFDERVWSAITHTAYLEPSLPDNVKDFRLTMVDPDGGNDVIIAFDRSDLRKLKKGRIQPETFISKCVSFQ
ncbi:hypothetical protein ES708_28054 [subsurface metagenome]